MVPEGQVHVAALSLSMYDLAGRLVTSQRSAEMADLVPNPAVTYNRLIDDNIL